MIHVSEAAKEKIFDLMSEEGISSDKGYVRVGVQSGGCSGLSYKMDFDLMKMDTDKLFEHNDVKLLVDSKSFLYLAGTTLDYTGGLNGKGFVFKNPNAKRTCGCGESFSL